MRYTLMEKTALAVSGVTAFGIGLSILVAPNAFYAGYGIVLTGDPSLLSELRAPAAGLVAFGGLMLAGLWSASVAPLSIVISLTVFLAFPAGRLLGLAVDGAPSGGILGALAIEFIIAAFSVYAFRRRLGLARTHSVSS